MYNNKFTESFFACHKINITLSLPICTIEFRTFGVSHLMYAILGTRVRNDALQ